MATIQFKSGSDYMARIRKLGEMLDQEVCGKAVYKAAGIVTDSIRSGISSVPTRTKEHPKTGLSPSERSGLEKGLGIAKLSNDNGFVNVKIGFAGYNDHSTKRWPSGQPNAVIARSIERGTTFRHATHFVKKAVASTRKEAIDAMGRVVDEEIEKIMHTKG